MTDLTDFLIARIAEDEEAARAASDYGERWRAGEPGIYPSDERHHPGAIMAGPYGPLEDQYAEHIATWDPAHVLAECEAKRQIIRLHAPNPEDYWERNQHSEKVYTTGCCEVCVDQRPEFREEWICQTWPCPTVRLLALPYADHSDYDESWRV